MLPPHAGCLQSQAMLVVAALSSHICEQNFLSAGTAQEHDAWAHFFASDIGKPPRTVTC
jgi:hypothetical protein